MRPSNARAAERAADRQRRVIARDIERAMADSGMGVRALARASGVDDGYLTRILAVSARPSLEVYQRLAVALGADLAVRIYPNTGPAIHDRWQAPMLEHLLDTAHPRFGRHTEVGVLRPARGWIDAVLHEPRERLLLAAELESTLRRLEQLIRWHATKADSLPSWQRWIELGPDTLTSRLLVVRRTRATRRLASEFARQLRVAYPAHPDDALESLTGTAPWPGAALAWMTVEAGAVRWAPGR